MPSERILEVLESILVKQAIFVVIYFLGVSKEAR